jgi:hypothetical protein
MKTYVPKLSEKRTNSVTYRGCISWNKQGILKQK